MEEVIVIEEDGSDEDDDTFQPSNRNHRIMPQQRHPFKQTKNTTEIVEIEEEVDDDESDYRQ